MADRPAVRAAVNDSLRMGNGDRIKAILSKPQSQEVTNLVTLKAARTTNVCWKENVMKGCCR